MLRPGMILRKPTALIELSADIEGDVCDTKGQRARMLGRSSISKAISPEKTCECYRVSPASV